MHRYQIGDAKTAPKDEIDRVHRKALIIIGLSAIALSILVGAYRADNLQEDSQMNPQISLAEEGKTP